MASRFVSCLASVGKSRYGRYAAARKNLRHLLLVPSARGTLPHGFSVGWNHGRSSGSYSTSTQSVPLSKLKDSFIHGTSGNFLEELQRQWEADPNSVDISWQVFFKNFTGGGGGGASAGMALAGGNSTQVTELLSFDNK